MIPLGIVLTAISALVLAGGRVRSRPYRRGWAGPPGDRGNRHRAAHGLPQRHQSHHRLVGPALQRERRPHGAVGQQRQGAGRHPLADPRRSQAALEQGRQGRCEGVLPQAVPQRAHRPRRPGPLAPGPRRGTTTPHPAATALPPPRPREFPGSGGHGDPGGTVPRLWSGRPNVWPATWAFRIARGTGSVRADPRASSRPGDRHVGGLRRRPSGLGGQGTAGVRPSFSAESASLPDGTVHRRFAPGTPTVEFGLPLRSRLPRPPGPPTYRAVRDSSPRGPATSS